MSGKFPNHYFIQDDKIILCILIANLKHVFSVTLHHAPLRTRTISLIRVKTTEHVDVEMVEVTLPALLPQQHNGELPDISVGSTQLQDFNKSGILNKNVE